MGRRSRKQYNKRRRHLRRKKLREYHHGHTRKRIRQRYGLDLDDNQLEEIIALIQENRAEKVRFVRDGKKKNGDVIYLVVFCGKVLAFVYNPRKNWLVTCLKVKWVLKGLPEEQIKEIREWIRERCANGKNKNGNARR